MNLLQLLEFAKAGWKPQDVKDLLNTQEPTEPTEPETEPTEPESTEPTEPTEPETELDYKKLYEESQEKLRLAQQANQKADNSNSPEQKSDDELVMDFVKSFM